MYIMYPSVDSAASTASSTGSTAIYAYHPDGTRSWLHVEDLPAPTHSACAALLPSRELVVDNSEQQEKELVVAVLCNKVPQYRVYNLYNLLLQGEFTCVIACVCQVVLTQYMDALAKNRRVGAYPGVGACTGNTVILQIPPSGKMLFNLPPHGAELLP